MIHIINYGMGNLESIRNMLKKLNCPSIITNDIAEIATAKKLILPGVGAFDNGMKNIAELGLTDILHQKIKEEKIPVLGICLGMQLMCQQSEEGILPGLGWISAQVTRFPEKDNQGEKLRVPHMGWNFTNAVKDSKIWQNMPENTRFYYVHSYRVDNIPASDVLLTAEYGTNFCAGFEHANVIGVQFHPEKSHKFGKQLFKNFIENY